MPIPHEVTKEFFVPSEDLPILDNEILRDTDQMTDRINDLMFLFNLLDSAFGRNHNGSHSNSETEQQSNNESNNTEESSNENSTDEHNTESGSLFNLPNFERIRRGVLNYWRANRQNSQQENDQ